MAPSEPRLGTPGRRPAQKPGVRLERGPRLSLWQVSPVSAPGVTSDLLCKHVRAASGSRGA